MKSNVTKALAFISGLVVASVAVAVILRNNPSLRHEAERQLEGYLDSTRTTLETLQELILKFKGISAVITNQKEQKIREKDEENILAYDEEWQKHI